MCISSRYQSLYYWTIPHAHLAGDFSRGRTLFGLLQGKGDLLLGKPGPIYRENPGIQMFQMAELTFVVILLGSRNFVRLDRLLGTTYAIIFSKRRGSGAGEMCVIIMA